MCCLLSIWLRVSSRQKSILYFVAAFPLWNSENNHYTVVCIHISHLVHIICVCVCDVQADEQIIAPHTVDICIFIGTFIYSIYILMAYSCLIRPILYAPNVLFIDIIWVCSRTLYYKLEFENGRNFYVMFARRSTKQIKCLVENWKSQRQHRIQYQSRESWAEHFSEPMCVFFLIKFCFEFKKVCNFKRFQITYNLFREQTNEWANIRIYFGRYELWTTNEFDRMSSELKLNMNYSFIVHWSGRWKCAMLFNWNASFRVAAHIGCINVHDRAKNRERDTVEMNRSQKYI